jgi:hypothetical protein
VKSHGSTQTVKKMVIKVPVEEPLKKDEDLKDKEDVNQ